MHRTRHWIAAALLCLLAVLSPPAAAHTYGPVVTFDSAIGNLPANARVDLGIGPDGHYGPMVLDELHNLAVDCVVGCSAGSVAPYSGAPSPCANTTVGTGPTLILESVADGAGRAGGGYVLPATATAPVEYQWGNASTGLTTTPGGTVFQLPAGGQIPFAGAPNTRLYGISTAAQTGSCFSVQ